MDFNIISRRMLGRYSGLSLLGAGQCGWFSALAAAAQGQEATSGRSSRKCILLWMSGGPSQMETFDPHPDHENGGPTKRIATCVSGLEFSENLPKLATVADDLAVIRSMSTKEGDHSRATYLMHTGYLPQGPVRYPTLGSLLGHQLRDSGSDLPAYVSVSPFRAFNPAAYGPGFLGPSQSPLVVESSTTGDADTRRISFEVSNLKRPASTTATQNEARLQLLTALEHNFLTDRPDRPGHSHLQSYQQAVRMMNSTGIEAFDLDQEDKVLRDAYGRNAFGQGCLLARRLLERGVSFVEVNLSSSDGSGGGAGWDTHADNFDSVRSLCGVLDPAWATLMNDLKQRGLMKETLVIWMGEFGRTPKINENSGRDHWPKSWSAVLGGAGIAGGQAYGATTADGTDVESDPVTVPNLMATICSSLQLDPQTTNLSNIGRPIPLADHGSEPIAALLS
ncbi:MAG: DUF1501 domain-containing protein [Planctomycetaceae bacterium]